MAEQAILEVSLKNYKQQIDNLRASLLNLDSTSKKYQETAGQIKDMQDKLNEVMGIGKKQVEGVDGSYNQLSQTLSKLKQEWKTLEIGSDRWKELGAEINSLNDRLKEADASVGVFSRNVGNYTKSFEDAFKGLAPALGNISPELGKIGSTLTRMIPVIKSVNATATQGLKGVKAAIASTGIGALVIAIGLLTNYVTKNWGAIKDWIKGTTQARKEHDEWIKSLERVYDTHKRYIELLKSEGASAYKVLAENIKFAQRQEQNAFFQYAKDIDNFGKKSDEAKESLKKWEEAQKAVTNAILDGKDGITMLINEINIANKEAGMTQLEKDIAASNRRIQEAIALVEQYGTAWNMTAEEIAAMKAQLEGLMVQEENRIRRAAGKSAWEKEAEEVKKLTKEIEDSVKTEVQKLTEKYQKEKKLLEKHHKDTASLTEKYVRERQKLELQAAEATRNAISNVLNSLSSAWTESTLEIEFQHAKQAAQEFYAVIKKENPPEPPLSQAVEQLTDAEVEAAYNAGLIATKTKEELAAAWVLVAQKEKEAEKALKNYNKDWADTQRTMAKVGVDEELILSTLKEGTQEYSDVQKAFAEQRIKTLQEYLEREEAVTDKTEERVEAEKQVRIELNNQIKALAEIERAEKAAAIERKQQAKDNAATKAGMNTDTSGLWNSTNLESTYQARIEAAQNYLDTVRQMEYENNELREQAEIEAQQRLYEITREYNEAKIQNYSDLAAHLGAIFGSIGDLYAQSIANQVKYDGLSEKEAEKQYKKVQALKVSEAIVQTLQGALAAFMGYQSLGQPWGGILGAAAAAAVTAAGAVQIAQIKSQNPYSNGNVNASTYQASTPVLNTYTPDYVANLTGAQDTQYLANALADNPIKAYVVEADVTAKQEVSRARGNETTF